MERIIRVFPTADELADSFASMISLHVMKKPPGRKISLTLSGGSTPKAIFEIMAGYDKDRIHWPEVMIFWSDERCVAPGSDESNYRMAHERLLKRVDIPGANIYRIRGENDPAAEAARYSDTVTQLIPPANGIPRFDLIMLGIGDDGHTASLFPGPAGLFHSGKLYDTGQHPLTGQSRITATGRLINNAGEICFLVTGASKAERVAQILHKKPGWAELPASMVAPPGGRVTWLLDTAAASLL